LTWSPWKNKRRGEERRRKKDLVKGKEYFKPIVRVSSNNSSL